MKSARPITYFAVTLTGVLFVPQMVLAGGIGLYEIGTPDVGLASAGYAARAQDASTLFKNPAGMSLLDQSQAQSGIQLLYGSVNYSQNGGASQPFQGNNDGGNAIGALPGASFFYVYKVNDKLAVGLGRSPISVWRKITATTGWAATMSRRPRCWGSASCLPPATSSTTGSRSVPA